MPLAILLRLIAVQVSVHACLTGLRLAAPLWALRYLESELYAGIFVGLFAVSQVFLALPAGRFVDRHGLTRPVGISVLMASGGAAIAAILPSMVTLALGALLTGAASGLTIITLQRYVGTAARNGTERRQLFSWLGLGPSISNVLGPLLAGVMIDHAGFQAAIALLAVLPLIGWSAARGLPEVPARSAAGDTVARRSLLDLFYQPGFGRLLFVNWILSACWDVHTFMIPVIGHERGFSAASIGTILGLFAAATAAVRVVMPWLAHRLRERTVLIAALLTTSLIYLIYPQLNDITAMTVCSIILGLALGSVQPMVMSALHHLVKPERIGEAIALRLMAINASSVAMPILFGAAGAAVGATAVFWLIGTMSLGGAWVAGKIVTAHEH